MKFSRDDEREADRVGVQILRRAGWDPRAMLEFMQILREQQGRDPGSVEVFLSTHPSPAERVEQLRAQLKTRSAGAPRAHPPFPHTRAAARRIAPAPALQHHPHPTPGATPESPPLVRP